MKNFISRIIEETFPFLSFLINKKEILTKVRNENEVKTNAEKYGELDLDCLNKRIDEEHGRAVKIDEKTTKFTLGLSVSLTVLATASGSFIRFIPDSNYTAAISIICGIASLYMLAAGITALGALKTLPTYGYGTEHLIKLNKNGISYLSEALYAQERMNIIRHLRNQAAYQSLRNGFFMLFLALSISVILSSDIQESLKLKNSTTNSTSKNAVKKVVKSESQVAVNKGDKKIRQPTADSSGD